METLHGTPTDRSTWNYQITILGSLNPEWSSWLAGVEIVSGLTVDGVAVTQLSGFFVDQAALRGVLNHLWDLNLIVISIQRYPALKNQGCIT